MYILMHIFYLYKGNNYKIIIKYPNVFINILQESDKILNLETVMMTVVYFGSNKSISVGEDFVLNVNGQKTQNDKKKKQTREQRSHRKYRFYNYEHCF